MSNMNILNFSIGPVQGFIARARKTRDFWAGSFLLSYLAGQAMAVILENEGRLILPAVAKNKDNINDPLLRAIVESRKGQQTASQDRIDIITATLPNRFRAEISVNFDPALCVKAIEEKWSELAQIIWDRYLAGPSALGRSTEEIWRRQINNYWEINWILGEDPAVLDLRKNWRSHIPSIEEGDKCTLFGNLQELSGYLRNHEPEKQDEFWNAMRQQKQAGIYYDLEENERLCAIALVKRLFPHLLSELIPCKVPVSYPSTPYIAAINWIGEVVKNKSEEARDFAIMASSLPEVKGRENTELFPVLEDELANRPQAREFAVLDGNCFFKAALKNPNLWDRSSSPAARNEGLRDELVKILEKLTEPSPFYAMLLMDGDWLGALLQKHADKAGNISSALNYFSLQVPELVKDGNGVTVFAGGDDVLALMPLEDALATAINLRSAY
ncbi:MAG TPA: type III-B CRISPR-associated protein Cas10/Cmr2, partial [Bacillota bacterium]|nr:type III-B CRISPR-associated protein Cas10/Cmr2 [Bacillota bacterium]